MNKNKFFITTPIYYTNGIPHIGHSYSSIIADCIARYQKITGKKVKFSTGVDENSQKAVLKAEEQGMKIMDYLDMMASKHKAVWDGLGIQYTDFIRTTEDRHHKFVREVLQKSYDNGDIYEGVYEGMYCVGCEAFKKDEDLVYLNKTTNKTFPVSKDIKLTENIIKVCPDHLTEPQKLKEKNYFFKLSKYQKYIEELYKNNPEFVIPNDRFNEVKAFLERGLEDFSISRETNKFGIKLPFDESQVSYVWYDALFNYITVCKTPDNGGNDMDFWPADLHVVGKEIIRFHAIFWPAMLKSAGYELPTQILTTGFLTVNGQKISKSLGNAIDPVEFSQKYSKDLLTLYLLSSFNIGQDGDFSELQAILTYNAKLANNLGNLVNRVVVLSLKLQNEAGKLYGQVDEFLTEDSLFSIDQDLVGFMKGKPSILDYLEKFQNSINKYDLKSSLDITFSFLDKLNKFADIKQPWQMIKDDDKQEETRNVLYTLAEGLRIVGLALYIFFPVKMDEMFVKLGLLDYKNRLENGEFEKLLVDFPTFFIKEKGENLFNRFEI
ncbi:MAG: methionine--tRNA ligase [Candidatus Gracilibacteria bacterium]